MTMTHEEARLAQIEADTLATRAANEDFAEAKKVALATGVPMGVLHSVQEVEAAHAVEVQASNEAEHVAKEEFAAAKQEALVTGVPMDVVALP